MKVSEMIADLEKIKADKGDLHVMYTESRTGEPYPVGGISVEVAEKDEYPENYEMPEGFTYISLGGW